MPLMYLVILPCSVSNASLSFYVLQRCRVDGDTFLYRVLDGNYFEQLHQSLGIVSDAERLFDLDLVLLLRSPIGRISSLSITIA